MLKDSICPVIKHRYRTCISAFSLWPLFARWTAGPLGTNISWKQKGYNWVTRVLFFLYTFVTDLNLPNSEHCKSKNTMEAVQRFIKHTTKDKTFLSSTTCPSFKRHIIELWLSDTLKKSPSAPPLTAMLFIVWHESFILCNLNHTIHIIVKFGKIEVYCYLMHLCTKAFSKSFLCPIWMNHFSFFGLVETITNRWTFLIHLTE